MRLKKYLCNLKDILQLFWTYFTLTQSYKHLNYNSL